MNTEKKTKTKFEFYFFTFAAILLILIGIRFDSINPVNVTICVVLLVSAPVILKPLSKKYGSDAALQIKLDKLENMSESELRERITSLFTKRGFTLSSYPSKTGSSYICTRKGVRNGETFIEKGALLIICSDALIGLDIFNSFKLKMKETHCSQGMMITTSRFSPEVIDSAKNSFVTLWNKEGLRDNLHLS